MATPVVVQTQHAMNGVLTFANTSTCVFPSSTTAGNAILAIAFGTGFGSPTALTLVDSQSQTYATLLNTTIVYLDTPFNVYTTIGIYLLNSCAGGALTVTLTDSPTGYDLLLNVLEISGAAATGAFDGVSINDLEWPDLVNNPRALPSGGISNTNANDLLIGVAFSWNNSPTGLAITVNAGFSPLFTNNWNTSDGSNCNVYSSATTGIGNYDFIIENYPTLDNINSIAAIIIALSDTTTTPGTGINLSAGSSNFSGTNPEFTGSLASLTAGTSNFSATNSEIESEALDAGSTNFTGTGAEITATPERFVGLFGIPANAPSTGQTFPYLN